MINPKDIVPIIREEYDRLVRDSAILNALYAAGVDNWEWYGDALEPFYEEEAEKE